MKSVNSPVGVTVTARMSLRPMNNLIGKAMKTVRKPSPWEALYISARVFIGIAVIYAIMQFMTGVYLHPLAALNVDGISPYPSKLDWTFGAIIIASCWYLSAVMTYIGAGLAATVLVWLAFRLTTVTK